MTDEPLDRAFALIDKALDGAKEDRQRFHDELGRLEDRTQQQIRDSEARQTSALLKVEEGLAATQRTMAAMGEKLLTDVGAIVDMKTRLAISDARKPTLIEMGYRIVVLALMIAIFGMALASGEASRIGPALIDKIVP